MEFTPGRRAAHWSAIGMASVLLTACSQVQAEADAEAARIADHVLPGEVRTAITTSGAQTPEQRVAAAEEWLSVPDPSVTDSQRGTWVVRGRDGTSIRLDVYSYLESGSLFPPDQGEAAWGVACRSYEVGDGVRAALVECPDGTPEAP